MNSINFCIEGGINTSYIDSLIVALFYKSSAIDILINYPPQKSEMYYFQELVRLFVDSIRRRYSVGSELLNEIRNYSIICGWKQCENILELFDVAEYYDFLVESTGIGKIKFEIMEKNGDSVKEKHIKFIDISNSVLHDELDITNRELLEKWININLVSSNDEHYHFDELPNYIAINIKRLNTNKQFDRTKIDIMKAIRFDSNNNVNQNNVKWKIFSIICYSETNPRYYTLVNINAKWHIYDSYNIPSLDELDIKQYDISEKIKQECVMLFYKLDDI